MSSSTAPSSPFASPLKRKASGSDENQSPAKTSVSPGLSKGFASLLFHSPESREAEVRYPLTETFKTMLHSCPSETYFEKLESLMAVIDKIDGIIIAQFGKLKIHNKKSREYIPEGKDLSTTHIRMLVRSTLRQLISTLRSIYPYPARGAKNYNELKYKAVHTINTPLMEREMSEEEDKPMKINGQDHEGKLILAKNSIKNSIISMSNWRSEDYSLTTIDPDLKYTEIVDQFNQKIGDFFTINIDWLTKHLEIIEITLRPVQGHSPSHIEHSENGITTESRTSETPEKVRDSISQIHESPARPVSPPTATSSIGSFELRLAKFG